MISDIITISGDVHHIFPKAYLKKNGVDNKGRYNQVANYTYLDTQVNKAILEADHDGQAGGGDLRKRGA